MAPSTSVGPGRVFISYRRDDSAFPAGWLYDRLCTHLGSEQVFKDVDSIDPGDDFFRVIEDAVGSCQVLLALIGDHWLDITDETGNRRLDDPEDFVRLEIEAALRRDVRVIPILVGRAPMPRSEQLPASLGGLVRRHAIEVSPNRFESDLGRLVRAIDKTLAVIGEGPADAPHTAPTPLADPTQPAPAPTPFDDQVPPPLAPAPEPVGQQPADLTLASTQQQRPPGGPPVPQPRPTDRPPPQTGPNHTAAVVVTPTPDGPDRSDRRDRRTPGRRWHHRHHWLPFTITLARIPNPNRATRSACGAKDPSGRGDRAAGAAAQRRPTRHRDGRDRDDGNGNHYHAA